MYYIQALVYYVDYVYVIYLNHIYTHNICITFFVRISLTAAGPQRARLPIPPTATLSKKNLNASKPSEHPPSGGKCSKVYRLEHWL